MPRVRIEEVRRFMVETLVAAGAPETEAKAHADLLVHADVTGHFSHGLNRLELYINNIKNGATNPWAKPVILKECAATAWVDGCQALGATVGNFCMDVAIRKAKESGVGWVSAQRCTHFGMAGYWALQAEKEGLIGMAFTNSAPVMVPTRSKQSASGTNPIAMAAPAANGDSMVLDMASTAVAMGKIEVLIHKSEPVPPGWALGPDGKVVSDPKVIEVLIHKSEPVPPGWALGPDGKVVSDPKVAIATGRLLPLGGFEETSGYKGFGLSTMVEVLCSGLSGSNPAYKVPPWTHNQTQPPNLGQCYIALDPGCFAPGFGARIAEYLKHYRNLEPVDPALPVLAPGDKEKHNAVATLKRGTIEYPQRQIDVYTRVAQAIGVRPLEIQHA